MNCKYVGLWVHGHWARLGTSNNPYKMLMSKVSAADVLGIITDPRFSNPRLRTFRIYRESILHHVVSSHIHHNLTIAFIPSRTIINETRVENKIGDALFHRIMRAHKDNQAWKCCIVIPLLPGFTFPVDHTDASAVSLVLTGPSTIFLVEIASYYSRLSNP